MAVNEDQVGQLVSELLSKYKDKTYDDFKNDLTLFCTNSALSSETMEVVGETMDFENDDDHFPLKNISVENMPENNEYQQDNNIIENMDLQYKFEQTINFNLTEKIVDKQQENVPKIIVVPDFDLIVEPENKQHNFNNSKMKSTKKEKAKTDNKRPPPMDPEHAEKCRRHREQQKQYVKSMELKIERLEQQNQKIQQKIECFKNLIYLKNQQV